MRSLIVLCAGALVLSGCGATAASGQVHFAGNSVVEAPVARGAQARFVADPVAPPSPGTLLAKSEPAKEPAADGPAAAPASRETALRGDVSTSSGSMWNDSLEDAFSGGLALSGVGEGGGGLGSGIGYDGIGELGDGSDKGAPEVVAHAQMDLGREEGVVSAPRTLAAAPRTNADSQGRVAARFVMDRSGSVALASEAASPSAIVATLAPSREAGTPVQALPSVEISRNEIVVRTFPTVAYGRRLAREDF